MPPASSGGTPCCSFGLTREDAGEAAHAVTAITSREVTAPKAFAVIVVAAIVAALLVTGAVAATSPWVTKANAVCVAWNGKALAILGTTTPKTQAQLFAYMVETRPIEAGLLHGLAAFASIGLRSCG